MRLTAVFVRLVNLAVLNVSSNSDSSAWRSVTWTEALPFVVVVVVTGLVSSELFLRGFRQTVVVVCVGGALMAGWSFLIIR